MKTNEISNMPEISIIVPVYKTEKYLHQCIDSIISQTFTNWECILVDDGSPDNCPSICDEYAKKDSRINVIHQKNGGVSAARNAGLFIAQGVYIAFVDSDDTVSKDYLLTLIKHMYDTDLVVAIKSKFIASKDYTRDYFLSNFSHFRNSKYSFSILHSPWNKLYKRDLININKISFNDNISNGEDYLFNLTYLKYANLFTLINADIYNYRFVENSLSKRFTLNLNNDLLYISNFTKQFLDENKTIEVRKCDYIPFLLGNIYSLAVLVSLSSIKNTDKIVLYNKYLNKITFIDIIFYSHKLNVLLINLILKSRFYPLISIFAYFKKIFIRKSST